MFIFKMYCIDMLHPVYISINSVGMLYTYIPVHVHVYIQVYCIEIHCMYIVCIYITLFGVFITLYWCNILIFFLKIPFSFLNKCEITYRILLLQKIRLELLTLRAAIVNFRVLLNIVF